jgi:hypothetical protein
MRFVRLVLPVLVFAETAHGQPPPPPPAPAAAPTPSSQPNHDLQAGGLAPPEQVTADPGEEQNQDPTVRELEKADEQDAGRGLEFVWLNGEAGYQVVGLTAFGGDEVVDGALVAENQSGLVLGGALGLRVFVLTVGARFRYGSFDAWKLWTLTGEAGLRIPLGSLEFFAFAGAGYASLGSFAAGESAGALNAADLSARGVAARLGGGLDYYLSDTFSVGANLSGDALFLSRPALSADETSGAPAAAQRVYNKSASAAGAAFTATAVVGIHY